MAQGIIEPEKKREKECQDGKQGMHCYDDYKSIAHQRSVYYVNHGNRASFTA